MDLKHLVRDCSLRLFKEPKEMIRDRIVFGTNFRIIRKTLEKLINEGRELTLDMARTYEMSQSQMKSMEEGNEAIQSQ